MESIYSNSLDYQKYELEHGYVRYKTWSNLHKYDSNSCTIKQYLGYNANHTQFEYFCLTKNPHSMFALLEVFSVSEIGQVNVLLKETDGTDQQDTALISVELLRDMLSNLS